MYFHHEPAWSSTNPDKNVLLVFPVNTNENALQPKKEMEKEKRKRGLGGRRGYLS
jgi:hypothetical protein